ncbi:MAG: type II secretion system F family protein [Endomicrobiaceae bacterium]|nr:type II secretion system F family protein [Endomicrobiaceae bacterium]
MIVIYFNWLYKKKQEQNYRKSVDKQIVESIRIFRNIILSGQSILQAIDAVSKQVKPPLSDEFRKIFERVSLGVGLDEALQESSLNIQSEQYKLFIDSVRISNITGAKLSDILDKIEKSITQRLVIYSKVEALTSQGKMSGNIISVVPFFIILFVYFIEPDMMSVLFTTLIGNIILFISIVMMLLGSFFMRKISEIDI